MYTRKLEYRVKNSDDWQCLKTYFSIKPDFRAEMNHWVVSVWIDPWIIRINRFTKMIWTFYRGYHDHDLKNQKNWISLIMAMS